MDQRLMRPTPRHHRRCAAWRSEHPLSGGRGLLVVHRLQTTDDSFTAASIASAVKRPSTVFCRCLFLGVASDGAIADH